jgi:hypothetical protein
VSRPRSSSPCPAASRCRAGRSSTGSKNNASGAHVLICMLACYLTWHLRQAWAPLTFTDENPPQQANPVTRASRSAAAQAKASYQHDPAGQPYRSFRGLLEHLATLTRNQVRYSGTQVTIPMLTEPTSAQRQAFQLIGAAIPLTLK